MPVFKGDSGICCEIGTAHYPEGGLSLSVVVVAGLFGRVCHSASHALPGEEENGGNALASVRSFMVYQVQK